MNPRLLLAAVIGGIVMFAWGFVAHMVLPSGHWGLSKLPNEPAVTAMLDAGVKDPGLYAFPWLEANATDAEKEALMKRADAGPCGILVLRPRNTPVMGPAKLIGELLSNILCALVCAIVLGDAMGGARRYLTGALLGLYATLAVDASFWNWYAFPDAYFAGAAIDQVGGGLLMGLVVAMLVRPRA